MVHTSSHLCRPIKESLFPEREKLTASLLTNCIYRLLLNLTGYLNLSEIKNNILSIGSYYPVII